MPTPPISSPLNTPQMLRVNGVMLHELKSVQDLRGDLVVGEFAKDIPFATKRFFLVFNVPNQETRGEHAHRQCHQFILCVKGSCMVTVDDGAHRETIVLDNPSKGLYLPPMIWGEQHCYTADAVLLVFASDHYDPADYIRNYSEFVDLARQLAV